MTLSFFQLKPIRSTLLASRTVENKSVLFGGPQVSAATGNRSVVQVQDLSRTPWARVRYHQGAPAVCQGQVPPGHPCSVPGSGPTRCSCNVVLPVSGNKGKCWSKLLYESTLK